MLSRKRSKKTEVIGSMTLQRSFLLIRGNILRDQEKWFMDLERYICSWSPETHISRRGCQSTPRYFLNTSFTETVKLCFDCDTNEIRIGMNL